jgi:uncharacterized protein YndB with AHSA1/START domain
MTTYCHSREVSASPAAVFAAISDPVRLARWWGPEGFTNTFDLFEFQPGGRWKFTMHGPDGKDYPNEATFTQIEPNAKVRIRHTCAPYFELSIEFQEVKAGTLITWVQQFDDPQVAESIRHIVEPANEQNLTRLERELASQPQ